MRMPTVFVVALLLCGPAPLAAQSVKLEFRDGKVDLYAQNATVRAILNEWGRLGRTQIVNGERVPGAPVTLELVGVYERQALEILLRGVSGYLVSPRQTAAGDGSGFDRIMILPTSNAPRVSAPVGQAPAPRAVPSPIQPPGPRRDEGGDDDVSDDAPAVPISNGRAGPLPNPRTPAAPVRERLGQVPEPDPEEGDPKPGAQPTSAPGNPFVVTPGSVRPGVIAPAPQPAQQRPTQAER